MMFYPFQPIQFMDGLLVPPRGFSTGGAGPTSLSFVGSTLSNSSSILVHASAVEGDLAVLFDVSWNSSSGPPTEVVPSTWTLCTPSTTQDSASNDTRTVISYKVLGAAPGGTSVTGMDAISDNKIMFVFHPDAAISTVTLGSWASENTANNPASQTVTASGQATPLLVLGLTYEVAGASSFSTASPAFDSAVLETGQGDMYAAYKIYNSAPANHTIDQIDEGNANVLASGYLRVS
jgi:hypothetical protein